MKLDNRLEQSSEFITDLPLCQARLSTNSAFPWVLLIPRLDNVIEITDLSPIEQHQLMDEMTLASKVMKQLFTPDKINVATLGNIVPQLHIHVIARYRTDAAWPNPVWNTVNTAYTPENLKERIGKIRKLIFLNLPK